MKTIKTTEKTTEKQQIKIYRADVKKSFGQIPNWLLFKIAQRLSATEHHAYCLLAYFLSLKSFTVITAKTLAKDTGHSERSIYRYLAHLAKIGHVRIIKIKGADMRFITTVYEVYLDKFFWRNNDTNWQKDDIIEYNCQNDTENELYKNTNWQKDENKAKNAGSYYKNTPRARAHNTENNTVNPTDCYSVEQKKSPPDRRVFFAAVPAMFRNKKIWVLINCLIKHFGDEALDFMTGVFGDETIEDPIRYLWGAIKKKRADITDRQSLKKPTSDPTPPPNPQKSMADKEEKQELIFKDKTDEELYNWDKYLDEYKGLPDENKQIIFDRILNKTKIPFVRDELIKKGAERLHEVESICFRIKTELGYRRL